VLATRPSDVLRIACARDALADVERVLKGAGRAGQAERTAEAIAIVSEHELERICRSPQHEGICIETRPRRWRSPVELSDLLTKRRGVAIALDRVRNSYNIGAILRSAAFFGIDGALLGTPAPHPGLDPNAVRVAEGGVEHLCLSRTTDLPETLARLKSRGVTVIGGDGTADRSAFQDPFERPLVLVLGNEREGLSERARAQCNTLVAIPGSGAIESLNVAVAAGVLIALTVRRHLPC
jgi:TrmH RNA methyltransferase